MFLERMTIWLCQMIDENSDKPSVQRGMEKSKRLKNTR